MTISKKTFSKLLSLEADNFAYKYGYKNLTLKENHSRLLEIIREIADDNPDVDFVLGDNENLIKSDNPYQE